jgi:hypothetical protein
MPASLWKVGLEIELLAPLGSSRYTLAEAIAQSEPERQLKRIFHHESEPSKVVGQPIFENLTLGFEITDAEDQLVARCVDDLTLQADLDRQHPPQPGWFRVVSDEVRLLRLTARHADLTRDLPAALEPVAQLFSIELEENAEGLFRLCDVAGDSILIGAPLPGERERPCELITAPLTTERDAYIAEFLGHARTLGFTLPTEAALHVHFDAAQLKSALVIRRLIQTLHGWGASLRALVGTNPRCHRLGPWDDALIGVTYMPGFDELSWDEVKARLAAQPITKFCDYNLSNFVLGVPNKDTFEVRIFPSTLDEVEALKSVELFEALLLSIVQGDVPQVNPPRHQREYETSLCALLDALQRADHLKDDAVRFWRARASDLKVT